MLMFVFWSDGRRAGVPVFSASCADNRGGVLDFSAPPKAFIRSLIVAVRSSSAVGGVAAGEFWKAFIRSLIVTERSNDCDRRLGSTASRAPAKRARRSSMCVVYVRLSMAACAN